MTALTALLVATPIFGLSLQPPQAAPLDLVSSSVAIEAGDDGDGSGDGELSEQERYVADMKLRNDRVPIHRILGIATWGAMTGTVVLGSIQYYNLYGIFAGRGDNPCVKGEAIFGQGQCSGRAWPHLGAASLTAGLYISTGTLAVLMPDPDDLSDGPGEFASTLRMHKLLRWVHMGGMIAQGVLGVFVANPHLMGMDRANDYDALQTLSTVHLATGLITYAALTWAGSLMLF